MDDFTLIRVTRLLSSFKQKHGRDATEAELKAEGIDAQILDGLVRKGMVDKYQVTTGKGSTENRFKLHRDWRSLKET